MIKVGLHRLLTSGVALALVAGTSCCLAQQPRSFAVNPSLIGGEDVTGPYVVSENWPKPLSDQLPDAKGWTWGAAQSIFAETPDRIYGLMRGMLPDMKTPKSRMVDEGGRKLVYPIGRLPWRDATETSPPAAAGPGNPGDIGITEWLKQGYQFDVDAKWAHCIVVFNRNGDIIETWTQWDSILQRPHWVGVSPYDPQKRVWIIDDQKNAVFIFSHDGKQLLQTLGEPGKAGNDKTHFDRPTKIDWLPDGTFFVSDGYNGTRVVKFDPKGNYLLEWGKPGVRGTETRPGYFYLVHSLAVDPKSRHVFVNDRSNRRVQVFDENGKYLYEWSFGPLPVDIHDLLITADGHLWAVDRGTNKLLKYDLKGHLLYSWGTWGNFPGGFWGVHGMSVDTEGNFYTAEADNGRFQRFTPRPDAPKNLLVGAPVRQAWK
jgi:DNA-binding beta-propeller fold protein YncE